MVINPSGNVGIGTTSPSELLDVRNAYREPTNGEFTQLLSSTTTQDAGRGGSLGFGGFTNGTSGYTTFAGFKGFKENGDGGNTAGSLAFYTRVNGGAINERMRITSGGEFVFNSTNPDGYKFKVRGDVGIGQFTNGTAAIDAYGSIAYFGCNTATNGIAINSGGLVSINSLISTFTTGNAANMFVSPGDGAIYRSTSSIKYKKNVQDYTRGLADVMKLRPVTYEGKSDIDNGKTFAGLIAEEVHDLGLTEFVQYAEDGSPDALSYQNMIALAFKAIQELKAEIEILKNK